MSDDDVEELEKELEKTKWLTQIYLQSLN
jgi:hypothetical protein